MRDDQLRRRGTSCDSMGSAEEAEVLAEYGRRACATPAVGPGRLEGRCSGAAVQNRLRFDWSPTARETIEIFTIDSSGAEASTTTPGASTMSPGTCVAASNPNRSSKRWRRRSRAPTRRRSCLSWFLPRTSHCGEQATSRADLRSALAEGAIARPYRRPLMKRWWSPGPGTHRKA